MRAWLSRTDGRALVLAGFLLLCCAYEYGRAFAHRPYPFHIWRQTTCLSIAWMYHHGEGTLFEPELQNLISDDHTQGKSAAEFPLLYYVVGQLWKLTGPSEMLYRVLMCLLHAGGTLALFSILRAASGARWLPLLLSLLFFTSPMVVYFGIGFLPDVPSLDLSLIAWSCFARHQLQGRRHSLVMAFVWFTLAALLKITAVMSLMALLGVFVVGLLLPTIYAGNWRIFQHKWAFAVLAAISLACIVGWHVHAQEYNSIHGANYSVQSTWAIWDLEPEQVRNAWIHGKEFVVHQVFDTSVWVALGVMAVYVLLHAPRIDPAVMLFNLLLFAGCLLYILLWFITLDNHDYYYICPLVTLISLACTALGTFKQQHPKAFASRWTLVAVSVLLAYNVAYARNNHLMRTRGETALDPQNYLPVFHETELEYWRGARYWERIGLLNMEPYSRSIGIAPEDSVVCVFDESVCASLYLIGQRGWMNFGDELRDSTDLQHMIDHGAKYLFKMNNTEGVQHYLNPYQGKPIGERMGVTVYDISGYRNKPTAPVDTLP